MPKAKEAPVEQAPLEGKFYVCQHGQSNTPCACHLAVDPHARPVRDDWHEHYVTPFEPGLSDRCNLELDEEGAVSSQRLIRAAQELVEIDWPECGDCGANHAPFHPHKTQLFDPDES